MIILLLYRFRIVLSVELSCAVSKKCSLMRLLNDCKFFFFFCKDNSDSTYVHNVQLKNTKTKKK